jgi:hypothetical protein
MMSTTKAIVLAVAASLAVQLAAAAMNHPVGGDGTWDNSGTNYNAWAAQQKIQQGDSICKIAFHLASRVVLKSTVDSFADQPSALLPINRWRQTPTMNPEMERRRRCFCAT